MAIPTIVNVGTKGASATNASVSLPASILADDILLLYAETQATTTISVDQGYTQVADSPQANTTTPATQIHVYWKRATGSDSAPTVTQATNIDHVVAGIIAVRGCLLSGNPWDVTAGGADNGSDTSCACATDTSTVNDCLVLFAGSSQTDSNTGQGSAVTSSGNLTNTGLTALNFGTNLGDGGTVCVAKGEKASAGAFGTLSFSWLNTTRSGVHTIALQSEPLKLGGISSTDTAKYGGGLGAESSGSTYGGSTLGATSNTATYP